MKKQCGNETDCSKMEHYAMDLVAYTMKMQCAITKKLEEARAYDCKAEEIMKKARVLENQSDTLMKEAEEMSKQLEAQLKKANILMLKTIECYKESANDDGDDGHCGCHSHECGHNCACNTNPSTPNYKPCNQQPINPCQNQYQQTSCYQQPYQNSGCGCNEYEYEETYTAGCNNQYYGSYMKDQNCRQENEGCKDKYWYK
ncbi:MAG: hypothetical protein ACRC30_01440 [Clostridium sp.]